MNPTWVHLLEIAGFLHVALLATALYVPRIFDWRGELTSLSPFLRRLFWVYGAFIVLIIIGFGTLSVVLAEALAARTPLARGVCAFISLFWLARLGVQLLVFDIRPVVHSRFLRLGYHGLTLIFGYLTGVYGAVALL